MDIYLNVEADQAIDKEEHADVSHTNAIVQVMNEGMMIICNQLILWYLNISYPCLHAEVIN